MPAFSTIATADLLPAATRLYTGLRDNAEIAAALAPYDYDAQAATDGLALIDSLHDAITTQGTEEAEKIAATRAADAAIAAVRAPFVRHRRRARRTHPEGSAGYAALNLRGSVPRAEADLLAEARHFYETLQGAPDLAAGIRSLTPEAITDALARLDAAEQAQDTQTRESGESQHASALRGNLEATLRAECSELADCAKEALADAPQLREVLGLYEPGT